jgi:hypothetical protein
VLFLLLLAAAAVLQLLLPGLEVVVVSPQHLEVAVALRRHRIYREQGLNQRHRLRLEVALRLRPVV